MSSELPENHIADHSLLTVLKDFGIEHANTQRLGNGLINKTYLIETDKKYILQQINTQVFKHPENIGHNLSLYATYLSEKYPEYPCIKIIKTVTGAQFAEQNGAYWRLQEFVKDSYTLNQADSTAIAYEAGKAVGELTAKLAGLALEGFYDTIPDFHNLVLRYEQFQESILKGNPLRIKACKDVIPDFIGKKGIVDTYKHLVESNIIPLRIQHHDTKINNVLFHYKTHKSIGLCDMDTLMPGYFISDLGDMLRTYLCNFNEEHTQFNELDIRVPFYVSLMTGYLSQTKAILTDEEKSYIFYAGEFMIYMQALRFLTDYLNDDIYYGSSYEGQNLNRALNQMTLLNVYQQKVGLLQHIIKDLLK